MTGDALRQCRRRFARLAPAVVLSDAEAAALRTPAREAVDRDREEFRQALKRRLVEAPE